MQTMDFLVPSGIGDISWVYSKAKYLPGIVGLPVRLSVPAETPRRGAEFIHLLPDVQFGAHVEGVESWRVISQCLPSSWPEAMGHGPFLPRGYNVNLSANIHMECGGSLASWLPQLPVDYHYALNIPSKEVQLADALLSELPRPWIAVYVSNREKDTIKAGGWSLWSGQQWVDFLASVLRLPECAGGGFVFLGAEYDRDKTEDVSAAVEKLCAGRVRRVIGRPLGTALHCLKRCNYCFAFPSGIGVLANVLRTPALMLLPWLLRGFEKGGFADPHDLASQRYRAWVNPSPSEAFSWFRDISMPQVLSENHNHWPER